MSYLDDLKATMQKVLAEQRECPVRIEVSPWIWGWLRPHLDTRAVGSSLIQFYAGTPIVLRSDLDANEWAPVYRLPPAKPMEWKVKEIPGVPKL